MQYQKIKLNVNNSAITDIFALQNFMNIKIALMFPCLKIKHFSVFMQHNIKLQLRVYNQLMASGAVTISSLTKAKNTMHSVYWKT